MTKMEPSDNAKFFEHGCVSIENRDFQNRLVCLRVCMPCCLFQAITPSLLGQGFIDKLSIRSPVSIWLPRLTKERLNSLGGQIDSIDHHVNLLLKQKAEETLKLFQEISQILNDPSDIIPIVPMGVYIEFQYRCKIDNMLELLASVEKTPVVGVYEFQWALASVLHCILEDLNRWDRSNHKS